MNSCGADSQAIEGGKIRCEGFRAKPGKHVEPGMTQNFSRLKMLSGINFTIHRMDLHQAGV